MERHSCLMSLILLPIMSMLSCLCAIRLAANPSNPAHEVTFPPNYVDLYEQKPKAIKLDFLCFSH